VEQVASQTGCRLKVLESNAGALVGEIIRSGPRIKPPAQGVPNEGVRD